MTNDERFDLMAAKTEAFKRSTIAQFNLELYGSVASQPLPHFFRVTWRDRLAWRLARVSGYCSTLWKALCGVELVEPYED